MTPGDQCRSGRGGGWGLRADLAWRLLLLLLAKHRAALNGDYRLRPTDGLLVTAGSGVRGRP